MEKRKINWQTLLIIILSILLSALTIFIIGKEKDEISKQEPEKIYIDENEEVLDNFTKEDAVNSMEKILLSVEDDVKGEDRTVRERMELMDEGKTDLDEIINEDTIKMLYLNDEFKDDEFNRQFTASALLTYYMLTTEPNEGEVSTMTEFIDEMVYLDSNLKTAHIPLDIFVGENKGVSFEMQYIDGEWKFNPYSSMMSLVMIVNYENQINELTKEE